jgi:hypothetical protein
MMPRITTKAKGTRVARGLFVPIAGIACKIPLTRKNAFTIFSNYRNIVIGRNVKILYLVVFSRFEGFYSS